MKIAYVLDDTLDTSDGVQQYVLTMGRWMESRGHDVHYIVGRTKRSDVRNIHSFSKQLRVKFNRNVVSVSLPASPRKIQNLLTKEQFDVLHIQMPYSPMLGARVISLAPKSTAIVGTFHTAPYSRFEKFANRLLGYALKPTLRVFDEVMSVSAPAQELGKRAFKMNSQIVPNVVSVKAFQSKTFHANVVPKIVFVGRQVARKGCHHFIHALKVLDDQGIDFEAIIIGKGPQEKKNKKLAKSLRNPKKINFLGFVSEEKKRKVLNSADLAVYPSTGGESFGIVLIEAMAAGSGVVLAGNNIGYASVMESLPQTLFDPHNHSGLADLIKFYLGDKKHAKEVHDAQAELVMQYDVAHVGHKVDEIYISAVAKKHKHSHN
jgi:phosphatidyl-myo-inositol alpha-mannosyltransferase